MPSRVDAVATDASDLLAIHDLLARYGHVVEPIDGHRARVRCKYLVVSDDGRARSGEYHDAVVHTADGWRFERRTVVPRRARPGRA